MKRDYMKGCYNMKLEEIGKSKFKFYSDGKIEYLWNESSEREEK